MSIEFGSAGDLAERVARWAAAGERYEVEFKSERRPLNDRDLVEAVVCLANGHGGVLLIGIEDDGTVTGARPRHEAGRTDPFRVQALVANMTQPSISVAVSLVELTGHGRAGGRSSGQPSCGGNSPGHLRAPGYRRGRPSDLCSYHAHEMLAHEVDRGAVDWAAVRVGGASWEDLDPLEFERLRQLASSSRHGRGRRAGLVVGPRDRKRARAGTHRCRRNGRRAAPVREERGTAAFLPTHEAAFQVLRGEDVEVNDFLPDPLFRLAERCLPVPARGTGRRRCSPACSGSRYPRTQRPHSGRRWRTR